VYKHKLLCQMLSTRHWVFLGTITFNEFCQCVPVRRPPSLLLQSPLCGTSLDSRLTSDCGFS